MESVSAMRATSGTTVTVPLTPHPVCLMTGRSAAGGAAVRVGAASALNQGPSGTPARNAPPAPMPVAPKGTGQRKGCVEWKRGRDARQEEE